eukprot:TRINITY_DN28879_c0_g1_i1.p1 TRINITY_DN28879_c0_g1~~TRINITY_DN28879_c0_g1_i1.p1  ORF type:complete len:573 (-),score=74.41 TRINITY_DN28879_c0_g1_i1:252-1904(-)
MGGLDSSQHVGGDVASTTRIFLVLVVTSSMVNFDSGGTAAILVHLSRGCAVPFLDGNETLLMDPNYPCLDDWDKGVLGAAPYVGLCLGCPLFGELLRTMSEKRVLVASLIGNIIATFIFASVLDKHYLWSSKFLVGLTQSALSIYAPVWVSKFAPADRKTLWYGLMQSSTAIGNLVGYAVCGYLVNLGVFYQHAFQIQAFWLIATCALLWPIATERIDVSAHADVSELGSAGRSRESTALDLEAALLSLQEGDYFDEAFGTYTAGSCSRQNFSGQRDADDYSGAGSFAKADGFGLVAQITALIKCKVYLGTVATICALYFVVTAVQYWASQYFILHFHRPGSEVTTVFILVAGSAPILGVIGGSAVVDRFGGYETPRQMYRSSRIAFVWGALAALGGVGAALIEPLPFEDPQATAQFHAEVICVWLLLFFGGAVLPAVTGIGMAAVPRALRKSASSWSMLLYNVFGFGLGSYLPGYVAEQVSLQLAMRTVFLWSFASVAALAWTSVLAQRSAKESVGHFDDMDYMEWASSPGFDELGTAFDRVEMAETVT